MDKIAAWIKITWAAVLAAPIVAPLLDLLQHRSVLVLLAGFAGYILVPQIQGLSPMWRDNLGQFIFIGTLLVSGRFTLEGILTARAGLPQTTQDYLKALLTELISPTPDTTSATVLNVVNTPAATSTVVPRPTLPPEQQAQAG